MTDITMNSGMEFCTRCQSYQNTQVTFSERVEVDAEGNAHEIVTTSYHCQQCSSFLRTQAMEAVDQVGESKGTRQER